MITIGTQVRHIDDPSIYGQVAVLADPAYDGPQHDVQVQHQSGTIAGYYITELRRETFAEFLFRRKGYVGKQSAIHALLWHVGMGLTLVMGAWYIAAPMLAIYYVAQYLDYLP